MHRKSSGFLGESGDAFADIAEKDQIDSPPTNLPVTETSRSREPVAGRPRHQTHRHLAIALSIDRCSDATGEKEQCEEKLDGHAPIQFRTAGRPARRWRFFFSSANAQQADSDPPAPRMPTGEQLPLADGRCTFSAATANGLTGAASIVDPRTGRRCTADLTDDTACRSHRDGCRTDRS